jgi:hypothetical protein
VARLAGENGWTLRYAHQVIEEYLRFLYLAARAGHPVSPSAAVDKAWHLHLVYTQHYWGVLCRQVLGFELHHDPTLGGPGESAKHADWYRRTLESYRAAFGETPPAVIWPAAGPERGLNAIVRLRRQHDLFLIFPLLVGATLLGLWLSGGNLALLLVLLVLLFGWAARANGGRGPRNGRSRRGGHFGGRGSTPGAGCGGYTGGSGGCASSPGCGGGSAGCGSGGSGGGCGGGGGGGSGGG